MSQDDKGFLREFWASIDWFEGAEDTVLILVAAVTGATASRLYTDDPSSIALPAFMLPSFLMLAVALAIFKGALRMGRKVDGEDGG